MKTIKYICFAALSCILFFGCRENNIDDRAFDFRVIAESVVEGEDVPVTITLVSGPTGSYLLNDHIYYLDVEANEKFISPYHLYFDELPAGGEQFNFSRSAKIDFCIPDAEAGTYYIEVTLERNGQREKGSAVVVVKKAGGDGPDDPPVPPVIDEIPVESVDVSGFEFIDGVVELKLNDVVFGSFQWYPLNATETDFFIKSSNVSCVEASLNGTTIALKGKGVGQAVITAGVKEGVSYSFSVVVSPAPIPVEAISVEGLELDDGRLNTDVGDVLRYSLSWSPAAAEPDFSVSTSNPDVVGVSVEDSSTLVVNSLYPGDAVVTVSTLDGVSTSFAVRVVETVNIVIEWEELQATDAQLRTKTFPCQLKISSDSKVAFSSPVKWTLTLSGVVNVSGKDTQRKTLKTELSFVGNQVYYYDVSTNFLVECYMIYRTENFDLSVTMALQLNNPLNSDYWKINIDEKFRTQDAKINQYITLFQ